jgi:hypothetical protein
MAQARRRAKPDPVKIFCGLIGRREPVEEARRLLSERFGEIDLQSPLLTFDYTDYYDAEMGQNLKRLWIGFEPLRERAYLARAKHMAVEVEDLLVRSGKRTVNIDPGYADDAQVVLATGKNFSHRIYIGLGYYAEVTLIYMHGALRPLDWTYPDYRSPEGLGFFTEIREAYHKQERSRREA